MMRVQAIDRHDLLQDSVSQAEAWLEKGAIFADSLDEEGQLTSFAIGRIGQDAPVEVS
jgi:hypothetical protein